MNTRKQTVIVSANVDADEANRLYGEAYGVDWKYATDVTKLKNEGRDATFREIVLPVMEWLNDNCHPHHTIVITPVNAELLEGQCSTGTILTYVKG